MKALGFVDFCHSVLKVTMEPGQRVFWAVAADGVQPCDLTGGDREIADELFGGLDTIDPEMRREVALVKGADVGFSFLGGLRLLHRALTATELGSPGEVRPALAVGPDLRIGRIAVKNALGYAESIPAISRLIVSKTADGFTLQRENGSLTSVECLPASVGGRALRGRRYLEVLFDEGAFFRDAGYAVNDVDCKRAVTPRCLGTFWNGSTPWLESSDVWKTYSRNYGHPVDALAARMPTLLVRTDPRVVNLVNSYKETDPEGAATEYECKPPAGGGDFYLDGYAVDSCADSSLPLLLLPDSQWRTFAGFDPAFQRDACAGVIVRMKDDLIQVAEIFERTPKKGQPLVPSQTVKEFAQVAKRHGCTSVISDIHYRESVREHLASAGLAFKAAPGGNPGKARVYEHARELIHADRIRWSAQHKKLTEQLKNIIAKPLAGGLVQISSPRRRGSHGDIASAFTLAVWTAKKRNKLVDAFAKISLEELQARDGWGSLYPEGMK